MEKAIAASLGKKYQ